MTGGAVAGADCCSWVVEGGTVTEFVTGRVVVAAGCDTCCCWTNCAALLATDFVSALRATWSAKGLVVGTPARAGFEAEFTVCVV